MGACLRAAGALGSNPWRPRPGAGMDGALARRVLRWVRSSLSRVGVEIWRGFCSALAASQDKSVAGRVLITPARPVNTEGDAFDATVEP